MARRELRCPNECEAQRFEALNAPLLVDAAGRYVGHDDRAATFVCVTCRSVAIDLAAVAVAMQRDAEPVGDVLVCPGCGAQMLPPEDDPLAAMLECPECGQRFTPEEGAVRLHGGMALPDADDLD